MLRSRSIFAVSVVSLALSTAASAADPEIKAWPTGTTGVSIGSLGDKFEASGIVWDRSLSVLWAVGDLGQVARMQSDGTASSVWDLRLTDPANNKQRLDLESVTVTGETSKIYLGLESPPTILEYTASATGTAAPQPTGKLWLLKAITAKDNSGMEALAWVPNGSHPYTNSTSGGVFYATVEKDGIIHVFDVDLSTGGSAPKKLGSFKPYDKKDISDLYYSIETHTLYVLYDNADLLVEVDVSTKTPTVKSVYNLKVTNSTEQEGVTLQPATCPAKATLYIADDAAFKVYSFSDYPQPCPPPPPASPTP
jgi:uncharacterized protein YjiK